MKKRITITMIFIILGLSGCTTIDTLTDDQKNVAYTQYIIDKKLESIEHIRSFNFKGWSPLTNDYLVLSSTLNKRYLIKLNSHCYDLDGTNTITTTQSMIGRLSANRDAILVLNGFHKTCNIQSIYPIKKSAVKTLQSIGKPVI